MTETQSRALPLGARAFTGVGFLLPPTLLLAWWLQVWFQVAAPGASQAQKVAAFLAPLPAWLQSPTLLSLGSISFCAAAILVSYPGTRASALSWRRLAWVVVVTGSLLGAWNVFTLM